MAPITFFDLPAELRNEIYAHIFTSPPKQLHHPWDDGPSCSTYLSLFLTCRQVYSEASSLLWKDFTPDITLHFDQGSDFESFVRHDLTRWPQLHSARFRLRVTVQALKAEAQRLVSLIPLLWPRPDILRAQSTAERERRWAIRGWDNLLNNEYRVIECRDCGDGSGCATYRAAETRIHRSGVTITCFTWDMFLRSEDEVPETRNADLGAAQQLDREIEVFESTDSLKIPPSIKTVPSIYYRARGRVTRECVIIEGRIGDAKF